MCAGIALCCGFLTGCSDDGKAYFGTAGEYVLKIGEDVFGLGKQGVVGGELPAEPESNEEPLIFHNYDVKKVNKAPKDEKTAYNLDGPENKGLIASAAPVVTVQPAQPGTPVGSGTVVVLTSGHCSSGNSEYEFTEDQLYFKAAANLVYCISEIVPGKGGKFELKPYTVYQKPSQTSKDDFCGRIMKNLCKRTGYGIGAKDSEDQVYEKVAKALFKCGLVTKASPIKESGGVYLKATVGNLMSGKVGKKRRVNFFKNYGGKMDKLVKAMNNAKSTNGALWNEWGSHYVWGNGAELNVNVTVDGSANDSWATRDAKAFFKAKATSGGSASFKYNGETFSVDEYKLNYMITASLAKKLTKEGYTVVNSKSNVGSQTLLDGSTYTNENISLFAAKQNAAIHFVIHSDSGGGSEPGGHLIVPTSDVSDKAGVSKTAADAFVGMVKKETETSGDSKYVLRENKKINVTTDYTTTNFAEVPTILMECFNMDNSEACNHLWNVKEKDKVTLNEKAFWGNGRFEAVKAAIEAVGSN